MPPSAATPKRQRTTWGARPTSSACSTWRCPTTRGPCKRRRHRLQQPQVCAPVWEHCFALKWGSAVLAVHVHSRLRAGVRAGVQVRKVLLAAQHVPPIPRHLLPQPSLKCVPPAAPSFKSSARAAPPLTRLRRPHLRRAAGGRPQLGADPADQRCRAAGPPAAAHPPHRLGHTPKTKEGRECNSTHARVLLRGIDLTRLTAEADCPTPPLLHGPSPCLL